MNNFAVSIHNKVIMKKNIVNPDKNIEPENKPCDNAGSHSAEETYTLNIYRPDYAYPFMPMMDLTLVFDELKKIMNKLFFHKRERRIIHKK